MTPFLDPFLRLGGVYSDFVFKKGVIFMSFLVSFFGDTFWTSRTLCAQFCTHVCGRDIWSVGTPVDRGSFLTPKWGHFLVIFGVIFDDFCVIFVSFLCHF